MRFGVSLLEPVRVTLGVRGGEGVLAGERRVPHDRIEPRPLAVEDLGELDRPMEWHERPLAAPRLLDLPCVGCSVAVRYRVSQHVALGLALGGLRSCKVGEGDEVAVQPYLFELML